jgi:tRNA threonylcarbamoyladenosine biosynthesis protein TsaB
MTDSNVSSMGAESPAGLLLALDTAGRVGSVALGRLVLEERLGEADLSGEGGQRPTRIDILSRTTLLEDEEHASLLIPRIQGQLEDLGATVADLAGLVVGAGPGSFTGLRVGAATAKGMVRALGLPLWAFSSLAGAAAGVDVDPLRPRCVLFDARGDRVYAAAYRIIHGVLETLLPPTPATISEVMDDLIPPGALLMGDGVVRHQALLEGSGSPVLLPPQGLPSAEGLLSMLVLDPRSPPLEDPARWEPEYLRESGAERMWKARKEWRG